MNKKIWLAAGIAGMLFGMPHNEAQAEYRAIVMKREDPGMTTLIADTTEGMTEYGLNGRREEDYGARRKDAVSVAWNTSDITVRMVRISL